jgi:ABC-type dipeptide/oligopeptide/nickel transport system ATPase component
MPKGCPFAPRCPYRVDLCDQENPLLAPVDDSAPDHSIACWVDARAPVPSAN